MAWSSRLRLQFYFCQSRLNWLIIIKLMKKQTNKNKLIPRYQAPADLTVSSHSSQDQGSTNYRWIPVEQMRGQIIGDVPESMLKLLWSLNYKEHLIPLIGQQNRRSLVWTDEQDQLILYFYFNQKARLSEIAELLKYKTIDYITERYRFMNLDISSRLEQTLIKIRSKVME